MRIQEIVSKLSEEEKMKYIDSTASEYFRDFYYSKEFSCVLNKLNSNEKLTEEEWQFLMEKLYLVTYKATLEEERLNFIDKINYIINRIGAKVFKKGKIHNECVKILTFLESAKLEKEINDDLTNGFERVEKNKSEDDLDILLKQHREAVIFRNNQDSFVKLYRYGQIGIMTNCEIIYMDCMDRSFIREKELVKEYK